LPATFGVDGVGALVFEAVAGAVTITLALGDVTDCTVGVDFCGTFVVGCVIL